MTQYFTDGECLYTSEELLADGSKRIVTTEEGIKELIRECLEEWVDSVPCNPSKEATEHICGG